MRIRLNPVFVSFIASLFVRVLVPTWRIEVRNPENLEKARSLSPRAVVSFLHGRLAPIGYALRSWGIAVLASEHPDGDTMGRLGASFGWKQVKGSSTRRGAAGFRELAAVLRSGGDAGLTVDGPRGPRGRVQQGATELSRMTGAVVLPVTSASRPRWIISSWDRFQFPRMFARVIVAYGEPFVVPADANQEAREEARLRLERTLGDLTAEVDRSLGYEGTDVWPHEDR